MKAKNEFEAIISEIHELLKELPPEKVEAVKNFVLFLQYRHKNEEKISENE
jgi:hypothetical protein